MLIRNLGWTVAALLGSAGVIVSIAAASPSPAPAQTAAVSAVSPAAQVVADANDNAASRDAAGADAAQSRNAARSRMRECGHQWSAMKKNGTASGMTWKDFSQGCLARQ